MAKFLTILVALVAAWFTVMLLGYLAVRLGRVLLRWALNGLAATLLLIAGGFAGTARLARRMTWGSIRWAIRRLDAGVAAPPPPARAARFDWDALPVATLDSGWEHAECGHPNRPEAKYCGKCGAPRSSAGRPEPAGSPAPVFDADAFRWNQHDRAGSGAAADDSSDIRWLDGADVRRHAEITFLEEPQRQARPA